MNDIVKSSRRSIPFSVTILTLMALIVVPLTSVLLWLGWRSVDLLEQRSADQRVSRLESAVEDFLTAGLHVVVSVGQTLAFGPSFNAAENPVTDEDRRHQLVAMLTHSFKGESCIVLIDCWHLLPPLTRRIIWTLMHVDLPQHFHSNPVTGVPS